MILWWPTSYSGPGEDWETALHSASDFMLQLSSGGDHSPPSQQESQVAAAGSARTATTNITPDFTLSLRHKSEDSQEFQNQQIEDNDKIPSARIPINFDDFGKPLEELKRSESNDLVPEIVVNIIHNIKQLKLTRPYFTSMMEDEPSYEGILLEFLSRLPQPLIPIEVSRVLIKIQEKYGQDHPYLCNSRFRHALHGCSREVHAVAQFIFHFLQSLCLAGAGSCHQLGPAFVNVIFGSDWRLHLGPLTEEDLGQKRHLLGRILSELISQYRAIFEIESSLENSLESTAHEDLIEPRKRHDTEEDECPEDIKAMKVAWEELSLECSGSKEGSPVKADSRPQTPEIRNFRENRQSRLDFVKTFVNTNSDNNNSGTHKESPVRCEENCCQVRRTVRLCSRKRKERTESSSSEQDNKFSRSSSLGCPLTTEELSLRWRSSSLCPLYDDGCGSGRGENVLHEVQESALPVSKKSDEVETPTVEDSRPRKKARNANRRTRKERCNSMKENNLSEKAGEEEEGDGGRGGGEEESPCWVSRTLQHVISVETDKETLTMINQHPANLNIFNSERHIEHNQHLSDHQNLSPRRSKHKQISKQLSNLKRRMEQLENNFVERAGYRPSQADKMTDPEMLCLATEQNRLKKEIRNLKENVEMKEGEKSKRRETNNRNIDDIQQSLSGIEKKLEENRNLKARPSDLDLMSIEQIIDEKLDIQTLLLDFERIHGHPETKEEKEAMKELYERYRALKMMVKRSQSARSRQVSSDLVSIPEDESLPLTLASPPHRIVLSLSSLSSLCQSQASSSLTSSLSVSKHDMDLPNMERADREDQNWQSLPREGLTEIQRKVKEEKKQLRRAVKELEDSYQSRTGRRLHKEDRDPFETTYQQYKTTKAKLKLIDALLSKIPQ